MNAFLENLRRQAEENPMIALAAGAAMLKGAADLMNSRSWKKEVARRLVKDGLKP